jgi:hypothetical protein
VLLVTTFTERDAWIDRWEGAGIYIFYRPLHARRLSGRGKAG